MMTPFSGISGMGPSRHATPFSMNGDTIPLTFPSRGPTPGSKGVGVAAPAPVQLDEDTEIAVAAELERNLTRSMLGLTLNHLDFQSWRWLAPMQQNAASVVGSKEAIYRGCSRKKQHDM